MQQVKTKVLDDRIESCYKLISDKIKAGNVLFSDRLPLFQLLTSLESQRELTRIRFMMEQGAKLAPTIDPEGRMFKFDD